jgi:undecaprenyl-diphosphatase
MLSNFDISLFQLIHKFGENVVLDFLVILVTNLMNGEFLFVIAMALLFSRKREMRVLGILILASVTISYEVVYLLKHVVARPRPLAALPEFSAFVDAEGFSFPSGHATRAFTLAFVLSSYLKRHLLFYALALAVCISRVYLGVHFPSDVFAGGVIGTMLGYALIRGAKVAGISPQERRE